MPRIENIIKELKSKELPEQIREMVKYIDNTGSEIISDEQLIEICDYKEFRDILIGIKEANRKIFIDTVSDRGKNKDTYNDGVDKIVDYVLKNLNDKK